MAGGQILGFSIDLLRRPYNTLALLCEALLCECVIQIKYTSADISNKKLCYHKEAARCFVSVQLLYTRMVWLPDGEKNSNMFIRFDMIHKRENIASAHIFVSPGDGPGAITLNVVWMER